MKKCIKCGSNSEYWLCDDCKTNIYDMESYINEIINEFNSKSNSIEFHNNLIEFNTLEQIVFELTESLSETKKTYYRIIGSIGNKNSMPKNKREWLYSVEKECLESKELDEDKKDRIKSLLVDALYKDYKYDKAEQIATELKNKNNLENSILFILADYYIITRRYDIAENLLITITQNAGIEEKENTLTKINECTGRKTGEIRQYFPQLQANRIKYIEFMNKLGIEVTTSSTSNKAVKTTPKRTKYETKIPIEEYPEPTEIEDAGFKDFVAFDVETTGLDCHKDSLIEIAAIKVVDGKIQEEKEFIFQELIHPYKKRIPEEVEQLTGITNEMVYNAREMWDVFKDFYAFCKDNILVGYNCMAFDSKFLSRAGRYSNIKIYNQYFDVMKYARRFIKNNLELESDSVSLEAISSMLGIENPQSHRALSDAITTAKVYLKLLKMNNLENTNNEQIIEDKKEVVIENQTTRNKKKLCYILYEYGATPTHVDRIMQSKYSLEEIKQNPAILKELFGVYSTKIANIIHKIPDVTRASIFDLCEYGLSKTIATDLFLRHITIEMLEKMNSDQLHTNYKIVKSSSERVFDSLAEYNKDSDETKDDMYENEENNKEDEIVEKQIVEIQEETKDKTENTKKSCFILYEYGATASHVNIIMQSKYTLEEIKQNPEILKELFGEYRSIKIRNIIEQIEDVNKESVYELCIEGLSKGIADELFEKKITIGKLEQIDPEKLHEEFKIGKAASRRVYEALGKYNKQDYFKSKTNYSGIINKVLLNQNKKVITLDDFCENDAIEKLGLNNEQIVDELQEFEKQGNVVLYQNNIIIKHDYLEDAIEKYIKQDAYKTVIREVLAGKKQVEVANAMNLTRERVRQIFNKAMSQLPNILEEDVVYKDIFTKYDIEENLFTELFMTESNVYNYLLNRYEKGKDSITELLDTEYFDKDEENIIKKHFKLITYNGITIKEDKMQLLIAILQTEGIQYTIFDLVDKYNKIIKENKYNLELINNFHTIESVLARQKNVIASNKRRYRYYNYKLLSQEDIEEIKELLDVDDGAYYTDYFFDKNLELMNKINIVDKNELYNLMKNLFSDEQNIKFSNMPIVLIGYDTKDEFLLEKMNNLSPILCEEFVQKISEEYGHSVDSLRAYITKEFYSYITKGMINLETKTFNEDEIALLRKELTKDIYSIKELKDILHNIFKKDCTEYIKTVNFEKLGFRIREQYIHKADARTVDEIIENEILQDNIFDYKNTRLKNIGSSFQWCFYDLIGKNKLIRYTDDLYYTEKGLEEKNIKIQRIIEFKEEVYENVNENQIFTLYNIKQTGICEKYEDLYVSNIFVESLIKTISGIKNVSVENNIVFIKSDLEYFNKADFIEKIILDNELTKITEIKEFLKEEYDINIELSQIKELISLKKYNIEEEKQETNKLEDESIENASDDYNLVLVLKFIEKIFGIGTQRNFPDSKVSEFLKRFDNTLNTLSQKEKRVVILKNGLKDGNRMTAEEVAEKMEIVSANAVGSTDRNVIEKLKDKERTKILRTYFDFSANQFEDSTADFILNLLK